MIRLTLILAMFLSAPCATLAQQTAATNDSARTTTRVAVADSVAAESTIMAESDSIAGAADSLLYSRPEFKYDSLGKRDPFQSLVPKQVDAATKLKQLFLYEGASVLGIVNSSNDAYALVVDAAKASYVLREGDPVYGGYVTEITDNAVLLHIVKYARPLSIVLRLESSKYTLVEEIPGEISIKRPGITLSYEKSPLAKKDVTIEEVTLPSPNLTTIDEEWFGSPQKSEPADTDTSDSAVIATPLGSDGVRLIAPPRDAGIRLPYVLEWTPPSWTVKEYTVLIDNDPDMSTPLLVETGISLTTLALMEAHGLPVNTPLWWRVFTVDAAGRVRECEEKDMMFRIVGTERSR